MRPSFAFSCLSFSSCFARFICLPYFSLSLFCILPYTLIFPFSFPLSLSRRPSPPLSHCSILPPFPNNRPFLPLFTFLLCCPCFYPASFSLSSAFPFIRYLPIFPFSLSPFPFHSSSLSQWSIPHSFPSDVCGPLLHFLTLSFHIQPAIHLLATNTLFFCKPFHPRRRSSSCLQTVRVLPADNHKLWHYNQPVILHPPMVPRSPSPIMGRH